MVVRRLVVDHVGLLVRDLEASKRFYEAALAPLGLVLLKETDDGAGFGVAGADDFWINVSETPSTGAHVAFIAESREAVAGWYAAARVAAGRDKSAPALRPEYHAGYYAAFVWDPDGNNVEAVFHDR